MNDHEKVLRWLRSVYDVMAEAHDGEPCMALPADIVEALTFALAAIGERGEPVGYANPGDYESFAEGADHTFTVYRYGQAGHDVPLYALPTPPTQRTRRR